MFNADHERPAQHAACRSLKRRPDTSRCDHLTPGDPAHLALFYGSDSDYVAGVMTFLEPALEEGDPIAVAVPGDRAGLLTGHLGHGGPDLQMLDMLELGRNPARIIPAVLTMIDRHRGRMLHYVGEPVWPGRSHEEIREATRHEALINLAWPGTPIRVLCPYDAARLHEQVLRDAQVTHPWLVHDGVTARSDAYGGSSFPAGTDNALPEPPPRATSLHFGLRDLSVVRALVAERATAAGLSRDRADDLIIAVNEIATNAIKHAENGGWLRVWTAGDDLICQLEDLGHICDPLAGRHRPVAGVDGGIGLWMVNQLCDLVEVRTIPAGTTIRLHARVA